MDVAWNNIPAHKNYIPADTHFRRQKQLQQKEISLELARDRKALIGSIHVQVGTSSALNLGNYLCSPVSPCVRSWIKCISRLIAIEKAAWLMISQARVSKCGGLFGVEGDIGSVGLSVLFERCTGLVHEARDATRDSRLEQLACV